MSETAPLADLKSEISALKAALDVSLYGMLILSSQGEVVFANHTFCEIFEFQKTRDVTGKYFSSFFRDEEDSQKIIEHLSDEDSTWTGDCVFKTRSGFEKVCNVKAVKSLDSNKFIISLVDLSESISSEKKILSNDTLYQSLIASMSVGVVIHDRDGKIIDVNTAALNILMLSREQMEGKTPMDPQWKTIYESGDPFPGESHPATISLKEKRMVKNQVMGIQLPDGSSRWISINSVPILEGNQVERVFVTFTDITKVKLLQLKIERTKNQLFQLVRSMPVLIAMLDKNLKFITYSSEWNKLFGYSDEQLQGSSYYDLFDGQLEYWKKIHKRALSGETIKNSGEQVSFLASKKDWYRWEIYPWKDEKKQIAGIIIFAQNVFNSKEYQSQIEEKNSDLEKLNKFMVNRELKMIELKEKIQQLEAINKDTLGLKKDVT